MVTLLLVGPDQDAFYTYSYFYEIENDIHDIYIGIGAKEENEENKIFFNSLVESIIIN